MTILTKYGYVESFESGQDFIPDFSGTPAYDTYREYYVMRIVGWDYTAIPIGGAAVRVAIPRIERVLVREVTHHPAIPPQHGQPYRPASVVINKQIGWNGGAIGIPTIAADGQYRFSIDADAVGIVTGFGRVATNSDYPRIQFGLYFSNSQWYAYESGQHPSGAQGYFEDGDEFVIRRLGPEVAYYKNGTLIYRSLVRSTGVLLVSACMYAAGDQIQDAAVDAFVSDELSDSDGELEVAVPVPTVGMGGEEGISVAVPVPSAELFEPDYVTITVPVPVPSVALVSPDAAFVAIAVPTPSVDLSGGFLMPPYGFLSLLVPTPDVFMYYDVPPTLAVAVPVPHAFLGTMDGILRVDVPTPTVGILGADYPQIIGEIPMMTAEVQADVLPAYFAPGIHATIPRMTARMYGAGQIKASIPKMTAAVTATVPTRIRVDATIPMMTASVAASAGSVATVVATIPMMVAQLDEGAAQIAASIPMMTALLAGQSGTVGQITATMPMMTAAFAGYGGAAADIAATIPMMVAGGATVIRASIPMMRAYVVANQATYTMGYAYAVTLNNPRKPVTRYTGFNFKNIVRLGDRYIGFGADGAYELTGADDNGEVIAWSFKFGETNEVPGGDRTNAKRTDAVYWLGQFCADVTMSVRVDQGPEYQYIESPRDATTTAMRITTGRGLVGHYWQFGLAGTGAFAIHKAGVLNRPSKRKNRHAR